MAQQQNDSLNEIPNNNENNFINDVSNKNYQQNGSNMDSSNNKNVSNPAPPPNMNDQQQQQQQSKGKSPQSTGSNGNGGGIPPSSMPPSMNDGMHMSPYGHPPMPQHHHHMSSIPPEHRQPPHLPPPPSHDEQQLEHMYNPQQGQPYGRYHDPNMPVDMYGRYHHPGGDAMRRNFQQIKVSYCAISLLKISFIRLFEFFKIY